MANPQDNLPEILTVAKKAGWKAAHILRAYYRGEGDYGELNVQDKKDGPVTAADMAANNCILATLQTALGTEDFGYLSEETYDGDRIDHPWVWIIDPLDGTRDFIEETGEYALHIALTHHGRPVLSVVVVPEAEKLYWAIKDQGCFVETHDGKARRLHVSQRHHIKDLQLVASRTHRDQRFQEMLRRIPFQQRNYVGSVGCKIATILEHQSDVYISLSGKSAPKDWDFAAPELLLTEAGGQFTHFEGHQLTYNQGDVRQWGGIMASNGHCHGELCALAIALLADIDQEAATP